MHDRVLTSARDFPPVTVNPDGVFVGVGQTAQEPGEQWQIMASGEITVQIVYGDSAGVGVVGQWIQAANTPPVRFTLPAAGCRIRVARSALLVGSVIVCCSPWGRRVN